MITAFQNKEFDEIIQHHSKETHVKYLPDLKDKLVIEFGPNDGNHTVALAKQAKLVKVYDVRPRNLRRTFANCLQKNLTNVEYILTNLEFIDFLPPVDVLYHSGLLYHLYEPVRHLQRIYKTADFYLFDTHIYNEEHKWVRLDETVINNTISPVEAYLFEEKAFNTSLIHGVSSHSRWMKEETLFHVMSEIGYKNIDIKNRYTLHENFKRITFTATP